MRYLTSTFVKLAILGTGMVTLYSGRTAFAESKERIVHFPKNRSMGMLYVLDSDKVDTSSYDDWQVLCEAAGDVTVPAGKALRLDLDKEAGNDLSPLSKLRPNDLVMFFCYGVEIRDAELKHISHLTGLQELYMRDTGILGTGLKYLTKLKSLKRLRVDNTHVGDNELAWLSNLPSLESLNLGSTPTNDVGMIHVGKITSLKDLVLSHSIGDEGLSHLKNLTSLRYLLTRSRSISDEGLKHLANMTQMETLYLRGIQVSDKGLIHLKKMKKLKRLNLSPTNVTEKGLVHLVGLKNLERLDLPFAVGDAALVYLSKLPFLKEIEIDSDLITPKGLAALLKMESLEHVFIDDTDKMDAIVDNLTKLSTIKSLDLGRGLTDDGLMHLKNMQSLQELDIKTAKVTSKGIAALNVLPSLHTLEFGNMKLPSEEQWDALGKLTLLKRLTLMDIRSKITDAHLAHLSGLQSLKELSIHATVIKDRKAISSLDVTDKGLEHISKLQSLERLFLYGAKITDNGLKHLEKLDSLKWMDLQGCNVTEEGLQRLKKKLPALRWHL